MQTQPAKPPIIAASTGQPDRRTLNGNNGTRRGKTKGVQRKRATGYYVLSDETIATLKARMHYVLQKMTEHYGGDHIAMRKALKLSYVDIYNCLWYGRLTPKFCKAMHKHNRAFKFGFTASFCRPDLDFDGNGNPKTKYCRKFHMLTVKK